MAGIVAPVGRNVKKGGTVIGGGFGYISGTSPGLVTVNGAPAAREVELRDRAARVTLRIQFSKSDGTYLFACLDPTRKYDVIARDWQGVYNDVIRSNITPAT